MMNRIAIDMARAITPPSLFGIDRRIAYAYRKYHSGWICTGVTSGFAGVKMSGSLRMYVRYSYLVVFVLQVEALLQPAKRTPPNISRSKNSNTQRTENKTTDVVIHQHSRRLLKMDILMSETC